MQNVPRHFLGLLLGSASAIGLCFMLYIVSDFLLHTPIDNKSTILDADSSEPNENSVVQIPTKPKASLTLSELIVQLDSQSDFACNVDLYTTLSQATLDQVLKFWEEWKFMVEAKIAQRTFVEIAIIQRLASLQPSVALDQIETLSWINAETLAAEVFRVWLVSDSFRAMHRAKRSANWIKRALISALVFLRKDIPAATQLKIARDLGMEMYFQAVKNEKLSVELNENFEDMWNAMITDSVPDVLQRGSLLQAANSWIEQDGVGVLDDVLGTFKGVEGERYTLAQALLARYASLNPSTAFKEASSLPAFDGGAFIAMTVRSYALAELESSDPALAARTLANSNDLKEHENLHLWTSVIHSWAESDTSELLANMEIVPESMHYLVRQIAAIRLAADEPERAKQLLKSLSPGPTRFEVAAQMAAIWISQDVERTLEWVLLDPDISDARPILLGKVLAHLALVDPHRAFELALQQSSSNEKGITAQIALESVVLGVIAGGNKFHIALELLPRVAPGSKLEAYREVSSALLRTSKVEEIRELASKLSEPEQITFYRDLVLPWSEQDAGQLFQTVRGLANGVRSSVAKHWLLMDSNPNLSARLVRQLKRFAEVRAIE